MDVLLIYLLIFSINCVLTIYLFRELKKEEQDKLKIKIFSWSLISLNFLVLFLTLLLVFYKKVNITMKLN
jgi:hypothetical protein